MKKNILVISSFIIFILSFGYSWFEDQLFNALFIFSLPIPFFLLTGFVICFIFSMRSVIKNSKIFINYVPIVILLITTFIILLFPFRMSKVKLELSLYKKDRNAIIEMVKNKELEVNDMGNIKLPNRYRKTSTSGEISVYQNDKDGMLIGFYIFRGTMSGSTKLMYSDKGEELIKENSWVDEIKSITKLEEKWFYVVTNY